jgi:predicted transcriptional regulator YdeE
MLQFLKRNQPFSHEPRIIDLEKPIKIVGLSIQTDTKNVYKHVPDLGKRFHELKKNKGIPNPIKPWGFAAVSKDFDKDNGTWKYIVGDMVTSFDGVPSEFETFEIPAIKYAVITVRPKNQYLWGFTISQTKKYLYKKWLPKSGYKPAGIIDDFEYHDEKSFREKDAEIDLYIAIKKERGKK